MNNNLSLRNRFLVVFLLVFLVGAASAYAVVSYFNQEVVRVLGRWFAEKSVLYEKSKVLELLLREVVLSQKMASSPVLRAWVRDEDDPALRESAMAELEDFRRFFRSQSYFFAIARSGSYYFADGRSDPTRPRYSLSPALDKDGWFYATLGQVDDYQLNVDTDRVLQVTKVWINTVLRDGEERLAVIGTGVDLSDLLASVIRSSRPGATNMLLDANGAIQAHPDVSIIDFASIAKERRLEAQSTVFNLIDTASQGESLRSALERLSRGESQAETLELAIQGKHHIAAVTYLPDIRWFLATLTHPQAAADAGATRAVAAGLIGVLAVTLLLAGLAFHQLVLRRLSSLDTAVREIAGGNYGVELPAGGAGDELGRLAQSFRAMARRVAEHTARLELEVAQRTQALERMAYTDFLTGLLNRRGILERIEAERNRHGRRGGMLGVLLIDLDHFKQLNDLHGHAVGDRALVHVAATLRTVVRSYDLCARWGGEEFLVIVTDLQDEAGLAAAAEKLLGALRERPLEVDGIRVALTASVGACLASPSQAVDAMLKAADSALYAAKQAGRDRVVVGAA